MTLGGNVVIRNGNELDFCWREAIKSLLPICDTVLVCDGESTDGTQEEIREWMKVEPKLVLCVYPWNNPKGNPDFFVDWINYARQHVKADYHFQLDADEVLSELSYPYIQLIKQRSIEKPFSIAMNRLNFWRDAQGLIPKGKCCSAEVIRIAPTNMWMASDGYHPKGEQVSKMAEFVGIDIFHYGFIRRREAYFKKEKLLHQYFFNSYDDRLVRAEKYDGNWMQMEGISGWENALKEYTGPHPEVAVKWLRDRGYKAKPPMSKKIFLSETAKYRHLTTQYCTGCGIDIASGGDPVVPWAWSLELPPNEYAHYNSNTPARGRIQIHGHADKLPVPDDSMDFVYSSHLLEDYEDWEPLLREWVRAIRPGGFLVVLIPDKELWNKALANGQPPNDAHKHEGRAGELSTYAEKLGLRVIEDRLTDQWDGDYSILFVACKL